LTPRLLLSGSLGPVLLRFPIRLTFSIFALLSERLGPFWRFFSNIYPTFVSLSSSLLVSCFLLSGRAVANRTGRPVSQVQVKAD
jgi:hypothetical protein